MNEKPIVRLSRAQVEKAVQTDWSAFDALTEADIERAIAEDPDLAPMIDWSDRSFVVHLVEDET